MQIEKGVLVWDRRRHRLLVKILRGKNHLYVLHINVDRGLCLGVKHDGEAKRWHARYGHIGYDALHQLCH
jgi:hypothetical protein